MPAGSRGDALSIRETRAASSLLVPLRDPWVLAVVATRGLVTMIHPSSVLAAVAVVEEWVLVERPQRSEDQRPRGATSDGENGRPRKRRQVKTTRFSDRMLPEVLQTFWAALQRGSRASSGSGLGVRRCSLRRRNRHRLLRPGGRSMRRGRLRRREHLDLHRAGRPHSSTAGPPSTARFRGRRPGRGQGSPRPTQRPTTRDPPRGSLRPVPPHRLIRQRDRAAPTDAP